MGTWKALRASIGLCPQPVLHGPHHRTQHWALRLLGPQRRCFGVPDTELRPCGPATCQTPGVSWWIFLPYVAGLDLAPGIEGKQGREWPWVFNPGRWLRGGGLCALGVMAASSCLDMFLNLCGASSPPPPNIFLVMGAHPKALDEWSPSRKSPVFWCLLSWGGRASQVF